MYILAWSHHSLLCEAHMGEIKKATGDLHPSLLKKNAMMCNIPRLLAQGK